MDISTFESSKMQTHSCPPYTFSGQYTVGDYIAKKF